MGLQVVVHLFVLVVLVVLLDALLVVSAQHLQPHAVVAGNRADRVHYVDGVRSEEGNGEAPRSSLYEVVQLIQVLGEVENCGELLVNKLADLGAPLFVGAQITHVQLLNQGKVFPL